MKKRSFIANKLIKLNEKTIYIKVFMDINCKVLRVRVK